ncbi:Short-chain alcohol dehydrogenase [Paraburkholderia piptadeniae]|uniref:Short-chain alcohol dehydrogenase n=1 Tax=Paraburkholderia piptadeniae TaxID=1701573 RepID=A0A1N7RSP8_9BURK|nr:short chain dehydrogenase [Paraburkholderia piptadeniae]SIT38109.1 Short-chain alcohol dehydrogenase [Paraburkholderia piptadeniae]
MRVLIVGATGLLGKEIVRLLSPEHQVIGASRNGPDLSVDLTDKASIVSMYQQLGNVDAVICAAGAAKFAPLESLSDDDFAFSLANKLMGQVNVVRCSVGHVAQGGSLTLTSGILSLHPVTGSAVVGIVNAGVEAFVRSAALELRGKARVNVVSPGWVSETLAAMGQARSAGVPAAAVAQAYRRSLVEDITGEVIQVAKW